MAFLKNEWLKTLEVVHIQRLRNNLNPHPSIALNYSGSHLVGSCIITIAVIERVSKSKRSISVMDKVSECNRRKLKAMRLKCANNQQQYDETKKSYDKLSERHRKALILLPQLQRNVKELATAGTAVMRCVPACPCMSIFSLFFSLFFSLPLLHTCVVSAIDICLANES